MNKYINKQIKQKNTDIGLYYVQETVFTQNFGIDCYCKAIQIYKYGVLNVCCFMSDLLPNVHVSIDVWLSRACSRLAVGNSTGESELGDFLDFMLSTGINLVPGMVFGMNWKWDPRYWHISLLNVRCPKFLTYLIGSTYHSQTFFGLLSADATQSVAMALSKWMVSCATNN